MDRIGARILFGHTDVFTAKHDRLTEEKNIRTLTDFWSLVAEKVKN